MLLWRLTLNFKQNIPTFEKNIKLYFLTFSLPPAYVVRREGNSFTLLVCSHLGGVPISHNALQHFPECHGADTWGGYPARSSRGGTLPGPAGGVPWDVPCWEVPCWGVPYQGIPCWGYPPAGQEEVSLPGGGVPMWGTHGRVPPLPGQDGGYPARGYPVRTTEGVLTRSGGMVPWWGTPLLSQEGGYPAGWRAGVPGVPPQQGTPPARSEWVGTLPGGVPS